MQRFNSWLKSESGFVIKWTLVTILAFVIGDRGIPVAITDAIVGGILLGVLQWLILRQQREVNIGWIVVTALGWIGFAIADESGLYLINVQLAYRWNSHLNFLILLALDAIELGLCVGIAQWWLVRSWKVRGSSLRWLGLCAAGFGFTALMDFFLIYLAPYRQMLVMRGIWVIAVLVEPLDSAAKGIIVGVVTGLSVAWMLDLKREKAQVTTDSTGHPVDGGQIDRPRPISVDALIADFRQLVPWLIGGIVVLLLGILIFILTRPPTTISYDEVAVSPDGTHLALTVTRRAVNSYNVSEVVSHQTYITHTDGSQPYMLNICSNDNRHSIWLSSTQLALLTHCTTSSDPFNNYAIATINSDNTNLQPITLVDRPLPDASYLTAPFTPLHRILPNLFLYYGSSGLIAYPDQSAPITVAPSGYESSATGVMTPYTYHFAYSDNLNSTNLPPSYRTRIYLSSLSSLHTPPAVVYTSEAHTFACHLTWSPDATTLAFQHTQDSIDECFGGDIWLLNPRDQITRPLTENWQDQGILFFQWSPDSRHIAVVARITHNGHYTIDVLDPNQPDPTPVSLLATSFTDKYLVYNLAWSPDSRQLYFLAFDTVSASGGSHIFNLNLANLSVKEVTPAIQ